MLIELSMTKVDALNFIRFQPILNLATFTCPFCVSWKIHGQCHRTNIDTFSSYSYDISYIIVEY